MAYFQGRNDCAYKMTADPSAALKLYGTLPMPSVKDMTELGILSELKGSRCIVKHLPGCDRWLKAMQVGDRIHLVETKKSEAFKANMEQLVACIAWDNC